MFNRISFQNPIMAEEDSNSENVSDDQFELAEGSKKGKSRESNKSKKHPAARSTHGSGPVETFDSSLSEAETELKLCRVFADHLPNISTDAIYELLSVRELRVILRVLGVMPSSKICSRKDILIENMKSHFETDHMKKVIGDFLDGAFNVPNDKKEEKPENPPEKSKSEKRDAEREMKPPPSPRRKPSAPSEEKAKRVMIPRLKVGTGASIDQQLKFIVEINDFVVKMNQHLCEMERITSVLSKRCSELTENVN